MMAAARRITPVATPVPQKWTRGSTWAKTPPIGGVKWPTIIDAGSIRGCIQVSRAHAFTSRPQGSVVLRLGGATLQVSEVVDVNEGDRRFPVLSDHNRPVPVSGLSHEFT